FASELLGGIVRIDRQGSHESAFVEQRNGDSRSHATLTGGCLGATFLLVVIENHRRASLQHPAADADADPQNGVLAGSWLRVSDWHEHAACWIPTCQHAIVTTEDSHSFGEQVR